MAALIGALCLAPAPGVAAGPSVGEEGGGKDIFGDNSGGQALVEDVKRACPNLKLEMSRAKPDVRILLLADRKMTMFYARACDGECDYLEVNNTLIFCRDLAGIKGCVMYAALYGGRVYDLSVDFQNAEPTSACGIAGK